MDLFKRHGETHFANLKYGYYVFAVSILYILVLVLLRKLMPTRNTSRSPKRSRLIRSIYGISPLYHLPAVIILLLIPFYHHYSLLHQASVYLKRLGRLSYVLVSLNLFITIRPNVLLPGYNYLEFIPLHKWLSRFITIVSMAHGIGFLVKWSLDPKVSLFAKSIKKTRNFVGLILFGILSLLIIVSLKPIRRYRYKWFYSIHNVAAWSMCFLTAIHARPGVTIPYLLINIALLSIHMISSIAFARRAGVLAKAADYTKTDLVHISLPRASMPDTFVPGSHLRISPYRKINPLYWILPSHPYTVASLPQDPIVDLIIREHKYKFKLEIGCEYTVVNSYNSIPRDLIESSTRVALVCGGSGISFALPLFKHLASHTTDSRIRYLKLVWLVRDKSDLHVLEHCSDFQLPASSTFEIFVTKTVPEDDVTQGYSMVASGNRFDDAELELEFMGDVGDADELDENGALVQNKGKSLLSKHVSSIHYGRRLDWFTDLSQFVESQELDTTWLVTCGPEGLVQAGKQYAFDNKIKLASEVYAL